MAEPKVPGNFNALYDNPARAARGVVSAGLQAAHPAVGRMANDVPGLTVEYDEATQNPVQVTAVGQAAPGLLPAARLSTRAAVSPETAARQFVQDRADLWHLDDEDVGTVKVESVSTQGLPTVRMLQRVDGVEVFQSNMTAAVGADQNVVSVTGQLFHGAATTPQRGAARASIAGTATLAEEAAIAKAAFDLTGFAYKAGDFKPARASKSKTSGQAPGDQYRFYDSKHKAVAAAKPAEKKTAKIKSKAKAAKAKTAPAKPAPPRFTRPVRVKDVLFPMGEGQFVPGYYMELWIEGYPAFSYVIDKVDAPDILFRKNLTSSIAFKYRVHNTGDALFRPEDGPAPGTPHPAGKPNGFQAPTIPEKLIEIESLLPNRPWLPPNATMTRGNNCIAFADLKAGEGPGTGDFDGTVTAARTFDTKYNHAKPSADAKNLQASIVGMFFHVNWLHDRWYEAGFDEASGNAQQDNFGLGGIDGDPILAAGNHFSGTDNANMSTPADGASPHMHMFRFDGPNPLPSRTSNHEALITFHEMGHYITNRLVANASGLGNAQGGAMGEGWGDFFAACMTSQEGDDFAAGTFAVGGWTDITTTFKDNYYYSIRRYPYSADMSKNPLTFKHISANIVLPSGPPMNPNAGGPNQEVHNAGEVWCCALWEVFVNLVAAHGHADAEKRVLRYVIGGLKLTPANPTFLQARNGIVSAASALDPADVPLVWKGFAKRGMGKNAVAPPASSDKFTEVVENFDVP
jgi:extracellular elastinolytic metalloproteinase